MVSCIVQGFKEHAPKAKMSMFFLKIHDYFI